MIRRKIYPFIPINNKHSKQNMAFSAGHGPTSTDYTYATWYAQDVMDKEECLAHPDKYDWISSSVVRYPCPEGLECETGVCKFKEDACKSMSELPYYDCVRRKVSCNTHPSGECEICDYSISLGRNITGPYIPESESPPDGCYAGDSKYPEELPHPFPHTSPPLSLDGFCENNEQCVAGSTCVLAEPEEAIEASGQPCTSAEDCGGGRSVCSTAGYCVSDTVYEGNCVYKCETTEDCLHLDPTAQCGINPADAALHGRCYIPPVSDLKPSLCNPPVDNVTPYTVSMYEGEGDERTVVAKPVPCETDQHCYIPPGVGGQCGRDPTSETYGLCYDTSTAPYLEWREEVNMWDGLPPSKNVCMETMPFPRKWCEMPWTRAGPEEDDPMLPLDDHVKAGWKSRARPPFWYDERDSTCHITRPYCVSNLKNGGFSAGYGKSQDYTLVSICSGGQPEEIVEGYDCCTKVGDAIGEFFLGRTITTDFRELVEGDPEGFGYRFENYLRRGVEATGVKSERGELLAKSSLAPIVNLVSDPTLKRGLQRIASHVMGPQLNIHGYSWIWSPEATRLYGLRGEGRGLITTEVESEFPTLVRTDAHGTRTLSLIPGNDKTSAKVYETLRNLQ